VYIITVIKTSKTQVTVSNFYSKDGQLLWLELCYTLGTADVLIYGLAHCHKSYWLGTEGGEYSMKV
jgi:hypothetical protein